MKGHRYFKWFKIKTDKENDKRKRQIKEKRKPYFISKEKLMLFFVSTFALIK